MSNPVRAARAAVCALILAAVAALVPLHAQEAAASREAWGVYADLVGHRFGTPSSTSPGYRVEWAVPGEEIREVQLNGDREGTVTLIRRAGPGRLSASVRKPLGVVQVWDGAIQPDGSIHFVRDALIKMPYGIAMGPQGEFLTQSLREVDGRWTVNERYVNRYARQGQPTRVARVAASSDIETRMEDPAPAVIEADTASRTEWGVYADLAGREFTGISAPGQVYRFEWIVPGKALGETPLFEGRATRTTTIRPGRPGRVIASNRDPSGNEHVWEGDIQPDGSVWFVRGVEADISYGIGLDDAGNLAIQHLERKDGRWTTNTNLSGRFASLAAPAGVSQPVAGKAEAKKQAQLQAAARAESAPPAQPARVATPAVATAAAPPVPAPAPAPAPAVAPAPAPVPPVAPALPAIAEPAALLAGSDQWLDSWRFVQGDKAVQFRLKRLRAEGTTSWFRIQYRVNSSDPIYTPLSNGYHLYRAAARELRYRVDFPPSFTGVDRIYELPIEIGLFADGEHVEWDETTRTLVYHDRAYEARGSSSCVDDNSADSRCDGYYRWRDHVIAPEYRFVAE